MKNILFLSSDLKSGISNVSHSCSVRVLVVICIVKIEVMTKQSDYFIEDKDKQCCELLK